MKFWILKHISFSLKTRGFTLSQSWQAVIIFQNETMIWIMGFIFIVSRHGGEYKMALCTIFTILLTLWNSEQKNGLLIKLFCFSSDFDETWWSCSYSCVLQFHQVSSKSDEKQNKLEKIFKNISALVCIVHIVWIVCLVRIVCIVRIVHIVCLVHIVCIVHIVHIDHEVRIVHIVRIVLIAHIVCIVFKVYKVH